ncbi:hypothetical protein COOONC_27866 [Cooperia oncophora]
MSRKFAEESKMRLSSGHYFKRAAEGQSFDRPNLLIKSLQERNEFIPSPERRGFLRLLSTSTSGENSRVVGIIAMSSSCIHMPSAPGEKKRLRSWYAVIADKCAFPRTDSYAVTAVTMGATRCSECPPEKRMSRLPLQMCCSRCSSFLCLMHMKKHLRENRHEFAMSIETGFVYCDLVCPMCRFEGRIIVCWRTRLGLCKLVSWNPTDADIKAWDMMTRVGHHAQLRGLLNMGSTCYMNSVLQALVHTPVLRDYFLSDQHCCQRPPGTCLMCTMHQLMQVLRQRGFGPKLREMWMHASDTPNEFQNFSSAKRIV